MGRMRLPLTAAILIFIPCMTVKWMGLALGGKMLQAVVAAPKLSVERVAYSTQTNRGPLSLLAAAGMVGGLVIPPLS